MAKLAFNRDGSNSPTGRKHGHFHAQGQAEGSNSSLAKCTPTSKQSGFKRKSSLRPGLEPSAESFQLFHSKHHTTVDDEESGSGSKKRPGILRPHPSSEIQKEKATNHKPSYERTRPTPPPSDGSKSRKQSLRSQARIDVEASLDNIIRNAGHSQPRSQRGEFPSSPEDMVPTWTSSYVRSGNGRGTRLNSVVGSSTERSPFISDQRWPVALDKSRKLSTSGPVVTQSNDIPVADGSESNRKSSDQSMHDADEISPGTRPEKTVHFAQNILGPSGTGSPGAKTPTKSSFAQTFAGFGKFGGYQELNETDLRKTSEAVQNEVADDENVGKVLRRILMPAPEPKSRKTYSFGVTSVHSEQPVTGPEPSSHIENTELLRPLSPQTPPQNQVQKPKQSYASGVTSGHPSPSPTARLPTPPTSPRRSPRFQSPQSDYANPEPTIEHPTTPTAPSLEQPVPDATSRLSARSTVTKALASTELDFLRSGAFDPRLIRPVPDLSQVFKSITTAFGEPGTGFLQNRFVPPSPQQSTFQTGAAVPLPRRYKGRKYSCNSNLKSRQVSIELLRIRLTHAFLLSFNLAADARRDVIEIGDLAGTTLSLGSTLPGRTLLRIADMENGNTGGISKSMKEKGHIGRGLLAGASGNRRRNSNKDAWIVDTATGKRTRRRESDGDVETMRERKINQAKRMARAISEGDTVALREASLESATSSGGLKGVGSSGSTNVLFWRLIRVSAVVEVDVKTSGGVMVGKTEEVQSAWWAIPERAVTGLF